MGERKHISARAIAHASGLFLVDVAEAAVVRVRNGVLELGPDAPDGVIASIGARRILRAAGTRCERAVRSLVESYGFEYVPESSALRLRAVS